MGTRKQLRAGSQHDFFLVHLLAAVASAASQDIDHVCKLLGSLSIPRSVLASCTFFCPFHTVRQSSGIY